MRQPSGRPWTRTCSALAGLTLLLALGMHGAVAQQAALWEAEEMTAGARISGGGDLVIIAAPDPEALPLSGGRALTFVPRGKGSALELTVEVAEEGMYQLVLRGVVGPSCGIYDLEINGANRGWFNFYAPVTRHSDQHPGSGGGFWSKRVILAEGENRLRFVSQGWQGRMGNLVLDTVRLHPSPRREPQYEYDAFDTELPPGERRGENLVKNGGVEDFTPQDRFRERHQVIKNWQFNTPVPEETPVLVFDPEQAYAGQVVFHLKPDPLEDNVVIYQSLPVMSERRYRVSFRARGTGTVQVLFYQPRSAQAEDTLNGSVVFPLSEEWQRYSYLFEPSRSGRVSSAALALYAADFTTDLWLDEVEVWEVLD